MGFRAPVLRAGVQATVSVNYANPEALRRQRPAWPLLVADHAPLSATFCIGRVSP